MARANSERGRKEREIENVKESAEAGVITDEDADAILELAEAEEGDNADGTIRSHIIHTRKTAERADVPLLEMTNADIDDLLRRMKSGRHPDVKDGGIGLRGYQGALRVFFRYHNDNTAVEWDEIDIDKPQGRELTPDDLLFGDEVEELLNAAQRANPRDMAFIAMALATGQRLDALRTLRNKHIKSDGQTMDISLNTEEGSLKGASGSKPLLWAKPYVRPWVEAHPYRDDPEAALFCVGKTPGKSDEDAREPMSDDAIRRMLSRRADDAGLEKDVYPHLLRHCACTRMVIEGLSEQKIKNIVGWDPDSSQFSTYVHLADHLSADTVREELGVPTSDTEVPVVGAPPLDRCPECHDQIPEDKERCTTCGAALTHREQERADIEQVKHDVERTAGQAAMAGDDETVDVMDALNDVLEEGQKQELLERLSGS